jgi:hypothetical protein
MTWFLIVFIHGANCPGKCEPAPAVTIQTPSQEICVQIKAANSDLPLECWAKPSAGAPK